VRVRSRTVDASEGFDDSAQSLFEALRKHRMELAWRDLR
jgi:hypothetical protein